MNRLRPQSLIVLGFTLVGVARTARSQENELTAAVGCVIAAWNAYDADRARLCYGDSAVAVWNGQPRAIDWEFEERLREFDAAARSRFRFEILEARDSTVEFTLYEWNQLIEALGLERVSARWRYTVRGIEIVREQLIHGDSRFGTTLREFTRWGRERRPDDWGEVSDNSGSIRFDGPSTRKLIELAREWSRSRRPRLVFTGQSALMTLRRANN